MNRADAAMYRVKHSGKNTWAFAEEEPARQPDAPSEAKPPQEF